MSDGIIGFSPFLVRRPGRVRHHAGGHQAKVPGQAQQAEPGSRPSKLDMAAEPGSGLGGLPYFSRPVTRTKAS